MTAVKAPPIEQASPPVDVTTATPRIILPTYVKRPTVPKPGLPTPAAIGIALTTLAGLLLGFLVYLVAFSSVQESHNQLNAYNSLRSQLDNAVAPVGPVATGTPVALLDIRAIGLRHAVVVQGTTAGALMQGPGLRSDTPLPGEAGVSVIFGRRSTFGGPFSRLPALQVGDIITATTGHGVAQYRVTKFASHGQPVRDTARNRLILVTADSSWSPRNTISASAVLVGNALPDDGGYGAIGPTQGVLAGDTSVLLVLMLWSLALVVVAAAGTIAATSWSKWPAWLLTAPVALAVLWNVYENAAHLLPNLL